jgi:N-acetylmuramoyl-L-alanine amidase CwlA
MGKRTYRTPSGKIRAEKQRKRAIILLIGAFVAIILLVLGCRRLFFTPNIIENVQAEDVDSEGAPPIDVQVLTVNEYSRPQTKLEKVKGIVIHYTANPKSSAQNNRDYFENLKDSQDTKASSHFVVGLEGEIIQCIPSTEISYASNERNGDTLAIECCHPDESGKFNKETYESTVHLTAFLCKKFGLSGSDVIRHYDITGKNCPAYFVDKEEEWEQFKKDVDTKLKEIKK